MLLLSRDDLLSLVESDRKMTIPTDANFTLYCLTMIMMQNKGYIFWFKNEYAESLQNYIRGNTVKFRETVPFQLSDKYQTLQLHFISITGTSLDYAVLIEQGKRDLDSVVIKSRLSLYEILAIIEPIDIKEIEHNLQEKLEDTLEIKLLEFNNESKEIEKYLLSDKVWAKLINEIKRQRPGLTDNIDEMLEKTVSNSWKGPGFNVMAQQKDAIQLALDITGIDKNSLQYRLPSILKEEKADNFFKYLKNDEDSLISHDLGIFGDWVNQDEDKTPTHRVFKQGNQMLTIANVNRQQYEKTLGVDLIYYHHNFNLFIMVQYKLWSQEKDEWIYRPNPQYDKDIERMEKSLEKFIQFSRISRRWRQPGNYRLNFNPFFFKLCMPTQLNYRNEMINGNYFDFIHLNNYLCQGLGKNGGRIIEQRNLKQNIGNELFVSLVKNGLIGSRGIHKDQLDEIVTSSAEENRNNIVLAIAQKIE